MWPPPHASLHKHSHSPQTIQACQSGCRETDKDSKNKLWNLSLTLKYRSKQFPADFYVSTYMLYCKFWQHSVSWWWYVKDLSSKAHVKNNTVLHSPRLKSTWMNVLLTMVVLFLAPPRRIQQQENGWKVENQRYWEIICIGKCVNCCIRRAWGFPILSS